MGTRVGDTRPSARETEILDGLKERPKRIAPKYFYDERGSALFERICEVDEYYITRTELAMLERHIAEIGALVGPRAAIVELGAGSNAKVRLLLAELDTPVAYIPVDISRDYLLEQARELSADYPSVHVRPVCADFTTAFDLPACAGAADRRLVFFPGSTIGNLSREQAFGLLALIAERTRTDDGLLIGVDLHKDRAILEAAYNDGEGVTAEFNLNVLARLNRELGANFELARFEHRAIYDESERRIEMRLVSTANQNVRIAGTTVTFEADEHIVTEHSHKYSVEEFLSLARRAGFEPDRTWVDEDRLFSVHYLRASA